MSPLELAQFIRSESQVRKQWLAQAKRMRQDADRVEKLDMTLATMLRRQALTIEQYQQRLLGYEMLAEIQTYEEKVSAEDERVVQDLFDHIRGGSR